MTLAAASAPRRETPIDVANRALQKKLADLREAKKDHLKQLHKSVVAKRSAKPLPMAVAVKVEAVAEAVKVEAEASGGLRPKAAVGTKRALVPVGEAAVGKKRTLLPVGERPLKPTSKEKAKPRGSVLTQMPGLGQNSL